MELDHPAIRHFRLKERADKLIEKGAANVQEIKFGTEEYTLYTELIEYRDGKRTIGKGEAGGIALAKTYDGILVSNNRKDIMPYVEEYGLRHLDTGQILMEALEKGLITEENGNEIWKKMRLKRRWLPTKTFSEYIEKYGKEQ